MNTATLRHPQSSIIEGIQSSAQAHARHFNKTAISSLLLALLFVMYVFLPHPAALSALFRYSVLFVFVVPLAALALSIFSIRHVARTGVSQKGTTLGYIALGITSLYFMAALAIPLVLIGLYLLYTYVLF